MSRQNYYARRRARRRKAVAAELVVGLVYQERRQQPRLGGRKLRVLLAPAMQKAGVKLGRDRFFDLMRERDLLVKARVAEFPRTTNSYHPLPVFRNQLKNLKVTGPNQAWVSDVTYLRSQEGFLYLALTTDRASRKIVGYHCGDTLEASNCVRALEMALQSLPAGAKPMHHSDRGTQYCCHEYVNRLEKHGLAISMTEEDHCAENALAERMNGILKSEYGLGREFKTKAMAREAVKEAVFLYNTRRPHSALNMRIPQKVHTLTE